MFRSRLLMMAVLTGLLLVGCATVEIRETRVVTGRVTDASGQPVAGTPVVVVARTLELVTLRMEYQERGRKEARAVTDAQGQYRIEFVPASLGNDFSLFFYDKTTFDRVKYRQPEPLDITSMLDRRRTVTVNQVLQFQQSWPEVQRQIAFYGPDSDRGKILRQHGLPEKRERSGPGVEDSDVWWYYADGVSYWFTGDRLARTQKFAPTQGRAPAK
ncbi:MAG TPA: carboxypeptidase-like regulatory domain-containing protein [archaeon]|nr:carboxypeptidase-like regulatory domain-containing protein [archaeon]